MQISATNSLMASFIKPKLIKAQPSSEKTNTSDSGAAPQVQSGREEFLKYAKMTPAQKMRAAMLHKLHVTEEELKAMPPTMQKKIEDQIKEMIKDDVMSGELDKVKQGSVVNITA